MVMNYQGRKEQLEQMECICGRTCGRCNHSTVFKRKINFYGLQFTVLSNSPHKALQFSITPPLFIQSALALNVLLNHISPGYFIVS